jgi:transposase
MTDLGRENTRLKKELRDAKMESDILKKAVSIFSRSDGRSANSYAITAPDLTLR